MQPRLCLLIPCHGAPDGWELGKLITLGPGQAGQEEPGPGREGARTGLLRAPSAPPGEREGNVDWFVGSSYDFTM